MKIAIRQTGAMRQQIAKRDRALRLVSLIKWAIGVAQHPHACQFRCALRDGLVEVETAFVEQHQRGDGRDRFCQRGDAEDRVALDRQPRHKVSQPDCRRLEDCAVSPD